MAVSLVTGATGKPVTSAQDGLFYSTVVGKDKYVTSAGSKCAATLQDANTLVVQDGLCLVNGRVVIYEGTTNFTIPSGTQGQKRAHLCGHRTTIDVSGNESTVPIVISGEPTSDGEPIDPEYNDGSLLDGATTVDHMLYRVITDGINALDPVALFTPIPTAEETRTSIAQIEKLNIALSYLPASSYEIYRYGQVVVVSFNNAVLSTDIAQNAYKVLSSAMPKPVCHTRSTIKVHKETRDYAFETISCAIGEDGVMTLMNTNSVAGMATNNKIDGELVYFTYEQG